MLASAVPGQLGAVGARPSLSDRKHLQKCGVIDPAMAKLMRPNSRKTRKTAAAPGSERKNGSLLYSEGDQYPQ